MDGAATRRVPISHPIAEIQERARRLPPGWPPAPDFTKKRVRAHLDLDEVVTVSDAMLCDAATSPDHLSELRALRIGSMVCVPLTSEGHPIGALTFILPQTVNGFADRDLRLAEDVAAGAALAITMAHLAAVRARSDEETRAMKEERLRFMTAMSHNFRTPLHSIYGYAQLLTAGVRGPLTIEQLHDVERIATNERHLLHLVDAVISLARWEGADLLQLEDVSVRDAVRRLDGIVARAAALKGVVYQRASQFIDSGILVRACPIRLHEVLLHLALNAVKFSRPTGTVALTASVVTGRPVIEVTDTGIGIANSDLATIFQPFTRFGDAYAREQDGVGLGLTITQSLARAMGGELSVASVEGRGTTFSLALLPSAPRLARQPKAPRAIAPAAA